MRRTTELLLATAVVLLTGANPAAAQMRLFGWQTDKSQPKPGQVVSQVAPQKVEKSLPTFQVHRQADHFDSSAVSLPARAYHNASKGKLKLPKHSDPVHELFDPSVLPVAHEEPALVKPAPAAEEQPPVIESLPADFELAPNGPVFEECLDDSLLEPPGGYRPFEGIYGGGEIIYLRRNRSDTAVVNEDVNAIAIPQSIANRLSTSDVDWDYAAGYRAYVGLQLDPNVAIEGSYFGIDDSTVSRTISISNPTNFLFSDYLVNPLFAQTSSQYRLSTGLQSADFMLAFRSDPNYPLYGTVSTGVRYIQVTDAFQLNGFTPGLGLTEQTSISTKNDLLGLNVGGAFNFAIRGGARELNFGATARGGLYGNIADSRFLNNNFTAGTTLLDRRLSATPLAASFETGINLSYRIKCIAFRGGYQLIYVGGLAIATDQLTTTGIDVNFGSPASYVSSGTASRMNTHGDAIFHGPTAGIEISWPGGVK